MEYWSNKRYIKMNKFLLKLKKNNGFTLVELMVATSIFIVILIVIIGSLITSSDSSKKSQALRFAMDNVNFAMESMSRSIRTGTNYYCDEEIPSIIPGSRDCPSGDIFIAFKPQNSDSYVAYGRVSREDEDNTYTLQRCDDNGNCTDMVSSEVNVEVLKFFVKGSYLDDEIQPSVYILMKGTINIKGTPNSFSIQTMASSRTLE